MEYKVIETWIRDLIRYLRQFIFHERNNYEKYDNLTQSASTKIIKNYEDVGKRNKDVEEIKLF